MEPLKPEEIARMLKYGTRAELDEYQRLLAERFHKDEITIYAQEIGEAPKQLSAEEQTAVDARKQRLRELYTKFYPHIQQPPKTQGLEGKLPDF